MDTLAKAQLSYRRYKKDLPACVVALAKDKSEETEKACQALRTRASTSWRDGMDSDLQIDDLADISTQKRRNSGSNDLGYLGLFAGLG